MAGQIIGTTSSQSKGQNYGVLTSSEVTSLVTQDKFTTQAGFVWLGRYDYSSTTFGSALAITTVDNGGYLDPSKYRSHLIVANGLRNNGPHDMNIVISFRDIANTGYKSASYYGIGHQTLQDNSDNNTIRVQASGSYITSSDNDLRTDDNSQATRMYWLHNIGDNEVDEVIWWRDARRSNRYTGRHNSYDGSGRQHNLGGCGGVVLGGYTTGDWNGIIDVYGFVE